MEVSEAYIIMGMWFNFNLLPTATNLEICLQVVYFSYYGSLWWGEGEKM